MAKSAPGGHGQGSWGVGLGGGWGLGGLGLAGSNSLGEAGGEEEELPIWSRSSSRGRGEEELMPVPAQETGIQVSLILKLNLSKRFFGKRGKTFCNNDVWEGNNKEQDLSRYLSRRRKCARFVRFVRSRQPGDLD